MLVLTSEQLARLRKARYKLIGQHCHSAVKLCLWTRYSIKTGERRFCYKQLFYPDLVRSHRCLQMTPSLPFCSLRCDFCWRDIRITYPCWRGPADAPRQIAAAAIQAQRELLSGLGGVPHSARHLREARDPTNAAISLAGEPTLYPKLSDLIRAFHKLNMTTFLVTNGCFPEKLQLRTLPTQLYVSLCSNSKAMLQKVQKPVIPNAWERLVKTLKLLPSLKTRKVIRLTMVKNLNMLRPGRYAQLISMAAPDFIEVKAFMPVGWARERLPYGVMPRHAEIKAFAEKISRETSYEIVNEKADSRVVLLKA